MKPDEIELEKWYDDDGNVTEFDDLKKIWYNDRVMTSFISRDEIDAHGDRIKPSAFAEVMPFVAKFGYYEWGHTGFAIGKMLGWRFAKDPEDNKVKPQICVGIHDSLESNIPQHDEAWEHIKAVGEKGMSSINGFANVQHMVQNQAFDYNSIDDIGVFAVGWVADDAANRGARVDFISNAKGIAKSSLKEHHRIISGCSKKPKRPRKKRVYVDSPKDAPEGANVQEGERGGYYYESTGGGDGGDDDGDTGRKAIPDEQLKREVGELFDDNPIMTDVKMEEHLQEEYGMDRDEAEWYVAQRFDYDTTRELELYPYHDETVFQQSRSQNKERRTNPRGKSRGHHIREEWTKMEKEEITKEIESLRAEIDKMNAEKVEAEKQKQNEKVEKMEADIKEKDSRIEELEEKIKQLEDEDEPSDEEEEAPPENEGDIEEALTEVEANVDKLAEAIESLEPGTPEAIEEAVSLAEEVKESTDTVEAMKSEDKEVTKRIGKALSKLKESRGILITKMSQPIQKSRGHASQRIMKAMPSTTKMVDEAEDMFSQGKGDEWWRKSGFIRARYG